MLIRTIVAAAALAIAAPAVAQTAPSSDVLSLSQVEQRLFGQGYRVIEIERDDGEYEVKALNAQGQCRELHMNLRTGDIRREEADDDCNEGRRRGGDRR